MWSLLARGFFLGLGAAVAVWGGWIGAGVPPKAEPERVAALVKQLGHPEFATRENAEKELAEIGEPALPQLRAAAGTSPDPEVRQRAYGLARSIMWGVRTSKSLGLEMVPLAAPGEFRMGSPKTEGYRRDDETQHLVKLTRPYLIGVYEVTQEEYRKVMKASPSAFAEKGANKDRVAGVDTGRFPVEGVSWFDALEFCNRLSKADGYDPFYNLTDVKRDGDAITGAVVEVRGGHGYRLPTEAEWEYACRSGSERAYHFGRQNTGREANLKPSPDAGGYGGSPSWAPPGRTTKVGSYKPNRFNLCDTHGNVGEWCWDWYDENYYAASPAENPEGPRAGTHRVVRGGSWMVSEASCRSASRYRLTPDDRKDTVGFRVARTP